MADHGAAGSSSSVEALQSQVADLERRLRGQQQLMERALTTQSKALLAEKARLLAPTILAGRRPHRTLRARTCTRARPRLTLAGFD